MHLRRTLYGLWLASAVTEGQGNQRFRLYSIECQKNNQFVLVSYFNTNELLLSYGKNDASIEIDVEVTHFKKSLRRQAIDLFQTREKDIELQVHQDASKTNGTGSFSVAKNNQSTINWTGLNCLKYGKD